eukprot:14006101-Ditylum_brightwellii.AAC.1
MDNWLHDVKSFGLGEGGDSEGISAGREPDIMIYSICTIWGDELFLSSVGRGDTVLYPTIQVSGRFIYYCHSRVAICVQAPPPGPHL